MMIFFIILKITIYSVSVENNKISVCFIKYQNTDLSTILIKDLIINFLSYKFISQSEIEYSIKQNFWDSLNKIL